MRQQIKNYHRTEILTEFEEGLVSQAGYKSLFQHTLVENLSKLDVVLIRVVDSDLQSQNVLRHHSLLKMKKQIA